MDLDTYLDRLAARGVYHFTVADAVVALDSSPVAVRAACRRLRAHGRQAMPFRGFHVIVPPEYRAIGCLPAEQFVPQLMAQLGLTYYAGLLSAAAFHGAAHQAPMVFQVVLGANRAPLRCGRVRVEFVARRNVADVPTVPTNTPRGILRVSTREATAFDLVGYQGHAGGLSNVATVLAELREHMDAGKLLAEAARSPLPWAQRLGYLLELVDGRELARPLAEHVASHAREYVLLRPRQPVAGARRDSRWRLLVNDRIETDL
jgi:predicted transcriptional regulator of viral defense system